MFSSTTVESSTSRPIASAKPPSVMMLMVDPPIIRPNAPARIVNGIEQVLPKITGMPKGMKLHAIFSQSTYIMDAIDALEHEAVMGAVLASVMILIFLGSFRSTFAIFLSIPLSIEMVFAPLCLSTGM